MEYREPQYETKMIANLYVECSLQVINFNQRGVAMSDCCRVSANSGVVMPSGRIMWRCRTHEGMVDFRTNERGRVVYTVERRINES